MSGINKAILVGNMGRDIEVKTTTNGKMGKFGLATSKKIKGEDRTTWHNIVVWDEMKVDYLSTYAKKGTRLYVEGEIENRKYENKEGEVKYISEVVVGRFDSKVQIMANGRNEDDQPASDPAHNNGGDPPPTPDEEMDDEVPF